VTQRPPTNMAASVHQRLKNTATESGARFNDLLQHYALERFLYRLSVSSHAEKFVLKGALLLRVWDISSIRPTRDIDLLGRMANEPDGVAQVFREICETAVADDGLTFQVETVRADPITEEAEYNGVRVSFIATLHANSRIPMQVDVGFGDLITPGPENIEYPSLLDMPRAKLRGYPPETTIAEKFHVMLHRGTINSRMKDYFDLWTLSRSRSFDGALLADAIRKTCDHRETPVASRLDVLKQSLQPDQAKQMQWKAFLRRIGPGDAPEQFSDVSRAVAGFIIPIAESIALDEPFQNHWPPLGPWKPAGESS
jgi:predicted nucleotidyltransferase component of viral defense system